MSDSAKQYVRELARAKDGPRLTGSQWFVLHTLAVLHEPTTGCAYPPMERIAYFSCRSEGNARKLIGELEDMGLLVRHAAVRDRDGSQTTNEYEFPGLAGWLATQEQGPAGRGMAGAQRADQVPTVLEDGQKSAAAAKARRQVFKIARTRKPSQRKLAMGSEVGAVEIAKTDAPPPHDRDAPTPARQVCAREVVFEVVVEDYPTPAPTPPGGNVQKPEPALECKSRTATAGATATATTEAGTRRWAGRMRQRGGEVASLAGADREVSAIDGFEPAPAVFDTVLQQEATRVLMGCGISPETSTRRMRSVVEQALRLRCEQTRAGDGPGSVADAGSLAVKRWTEYAELAGRQQLRFVAGVRKFFADGLWLNPGVWPVDQSRVRR